MLKENYYLFEALSCKKGSEYFRYCVAIMVTIYPKGKGGSWFRMRLDLIIEGSRSDQLEGTGQYFWDENRANLAAKTFQNCFLAFLFWISLAKLVKLLKVLYNPKPMLYLKAKQRVLQAQ